MELTKNPETELEYWRTIESLGAFIWHMEHEMADGRISDLAGGVDRDVSDSRKISAQLVAELEKKFGVIPPHKTPEYEVGESLPNPPEGKKWYWVWYAEMKEAALRDAYEHTICAHCPLSSGYEDYRLGVVPCTAIDGMVIGGLVVPFECGLITFEDHTQEEVEALVHIKGGEEALATFRQKFAEIKAAYEKEHRSQE